MSSNPYTFRRVGYCVYRVYLNGRVIGRVSWLGDEWFCTLDGVPERTGTGRNRRSAVDAARPEPDNLMPVREAAMIAGVPYGKVKGWVQRGTLPVVTRGTRNRLTTPEYVRRRFIASGGR